MKQAKDRPRLKLFPKRGYILILIGILIGFLIFAAISLIFTRAGVKLELEFLYTSEKQGWIEEVTPNFEQWFFKEFGINVHVKLTVGGTHETVNFILWESVKPTIWSPASSIWIPYINLKWRELGHEGDIATQWSPLVLSPVVIAGWKSFFQKYNVSGFKDLHRLAVRGIDYKYGHPDPLLSNGGTMALVLEFAEAAGKKPEELTFEDFRNKTVLDFVKTIEANAVYYGKSTGFFGRWAAENGPSAIDCFSVYENVVLDNSLKAQKKWNDSIIAVYPEDGTLYSDHPFVILNAPWINDEQRFAAEQYLLYLLSEENQEKAQKHGFRPANPDVPLNRSIFSEQNGVQYEIRVPVLKALPGEAMTALFTVWVAVKNQGV